MSPWLISSKLGSKEFDFCCVSPHFLPIIQVTASSWLNDLRDQIQQTRFLNVVYRSATALGTRLQSFSGARERVAGAGAFLRPVSSKTQVKYLSNNWQTVPCTLIDCIAM
jgi:hypothetical protein